MFPHFPALQNIKIEKASASLPSERIYFINYFFTIKDETINWVRSRDHEGCSGGVKYTWEDKVVGIAAK